MAPKRTLGASALAENSSWCQENVEQLAKAEAAIWSRLAEDAAHGDHTNTVLVKEIFEHVLTSGASGTTDEDEESFENGSVLLLGESGSGKTHAVEYCLRKLKEERGDNAVILRAVGGLYQTDVECIRHLASQVKGGIELELEPPPKNASLETGLEWLRNVLRDVFVQTSLAVIVLDNFEYFCSKSRQTLLYNLFDLAQEAGVRLSIIAMSTKLDVSDSLEKRIKSRFSMRHLTVTAPRTPDQLVQILRQKLKVLPSDPGLKASFVRTLQAKIDEALLRKAASPQWLACMEVGRSPSWFLRLCRPLSRLLQEGTSTAGAASASTPPKVKRMRTQTFESGKEAQLAALQHLCEDEHVVLMALTRLKERGRACTPSLMLHEVAMMHENCRKHEMAVPFSQERYVEAFYRLVGYRLVALAKSSEAGDAKDASWRYLPCHCTVQTLYEAFSAELANVGKLPSGMQGNPLRKLPEAVQRWAALRQRAKES